MKVLVEGAVKVDDLSAPISIRWYRDEQRRHYAESTVERDGRIWTFRHAVGTRSIGSWLSGTGGHVMVSNEEVIDALPARYRDAMSALAFALAWMEFE